VEVRSLGYRTDLAILALEGSRVTDRGDHLVIRTRGNPNYWWGIDPGGDAGFLTARLGAKRALTEAGSGGWFGAFLDGTLVMVADPKDVAMRVYHSVGFTVTEPQPGLIRQR
jgi:hypothetical protein